MSYQIEIKGTLGTFDGKIKEGQVLVSFSSDVTHETLSLAFSDKLQFSVRYDKVESLIESVLRNSPYTFSAIDEFYEETKEIRGLYTDEEVMIGPKGMQIAFRRNNDFSMLSIACEDKGEISVSYPPVEQLVDLTREKSRNR